jgi:D-alanyl-D-alanine carboxypeptidase
MSTRTSPLLDGGSGRRRNHRGRRRRQRRRRAGAATLVAVAVVALNVLLTAMAPGHHASRKTALGHGAQNMPDRRAAVPVSALGLPLSRPRLPLLGVNQPQGNELAVPLANPPRAGLLFDMRSGRVLWQVHPERRMPIASLTKMMTALLVVQSTPPNATVRITEAAERAPGSRVGVLPLGKHVPVEALMYGLLLPSGNDAADALAEHVAGSQKRFVSRMNAEAAALGLGCTRYSNPSGYFNSDNFSCAADLAELAYDDESQPRIAAVVRSATAAVPFPIEGGKLYLTNNNPLLIYGYRGTNGLKTGYTEAAGKCLVATADRDGVRLGVVLLNSPDPGTQAQQLLNAAFQGIYHQRPAHEPPIPGGV